MLNHCISVEVIEPKVRAYHVSRKISEIECQGIKYPFYNIDPRLIWTIGPIGTDLLTDFSLIEGIEILGLSNYFVTIFIAEAFCFQWIEPFILDTLKRCLVDSGDMEEVVVSPYLPENEIYDLPLPKIGRILERIDNH